MGDRAAFVWRMAVGSPAGAAEAQRQHVAEQRMVGGQRATLPVRLQAGRPEQFAAQRARTHQLGLDVRWNLEIHAVPSAATAGADNRKGW